MSQRAPFPGDVASIISTSQPSTRNMANPILGHWYRLYTRGTGPEKAIEPVVASLGIPYRWQHICLPYILDYFFPTLGLILEIDGASHDSPEAKEKDAARDAALAKKGWRTVRVSNEWALRATAEELRQILGLDSP